jgi:Ni/Co efflux regulator RcnB
MKSIMTAAAAAMLLVGPIFSADSADARHRHRDWDNHRGHYSYGGRHWRQPHEHRRHRVVRHRHHRWVHRGGVVIKIIVLPGYPYYSGCGGYCW